MKNNRQLILRPLILQQNDVLSINCESGFFLESEYLITNQEGRVMRKGIITSKIIELKLRLVGMNSGSYTFKMGEYQERFEII